MNDPKIVYMIQGVYFQEQSYFGIDYRPIEGAVAVLQQATTRTMFAGMIGTDEFHDKLVGSMTDTAGQSQLSNVELSNTKLSFDKRYDHRADVIHYSFEKSDDVVWIGEYGGELVGRGTVTCILIPVPLSMLEGP